MRGECDGRENLQNVWREEVGDKCVFVKGGREGRRLEEGGRREGGREEGEAALTLACTPSLRRGSNSGVNVPPSPPHLTPIRTSQ